jgi:hypothetical protein
MGVVMNAQQFAANEAVSTAAARLLVELTMLVPRGTDVSPESGIGKALAAYREALDAAHVHAYNALVAAELQSLETQAVTSIAAADKIWRVAPLYRFVEDHLQPRIKAFNGGSVVRLQPHVLTCHVCGRPAVCIGRYDMDDAYRPACDTCCGHGNEDGWCRPVSDALAEMSRMLLEAEEHDMDLGPHLSRVHRAFDALLIKEVEVFGGVPVQGGRLATETIELRDAIAALLEADTEVTRGSQDT